jgi:hypothetical protein
MKKPLTHNYILLKLFCAVVLILISVNRNCAQTISFTGTIPSSIPAGNAITVNALAAATSGGTLNNVAFTLSNSSATVLSTVTDPFSAYTATFQTTGLPAGVYKLIATNNYTTSGGTVKALASSPVSITITTTTLNVNTSNYGFSKPLVLNTSLITGGISTALTNFPVLVYIKDPALITGNYCGDKVQYPTGTGLGAPANTNYDFAFTQQGNTNELNYEIENYDQVNGILMAWVQIPSLTGTNYNLTFYFGSAKPAHSATFSAATWQYDYQAVYHFNDVAASGAGASLSILDATNNNVDANGAANISNVKVATDEIHDPLKAGLIGGTGGGYLFNGTSSSIVTSKNADVTGPFTLSAWVNIATPGNDNKIVTNELDFGPGYKLSVKQGHIQTETRSTDVNNTTTTNFSDFGNLGNGGDITANTWHYIQGVFDGVKFTNYVDGAPASVLNGVASGTVTTPSPGAAEPIIPYPGSVVAMGIDHGDGNKSHNVPTNCCLAASDGSFFNGKMDEVRVSTNVKTADWIKCEYYNQSNPVNFTNFSGAVVANPANTPTLKAGALTYTWTGGAGSTSPTAANNWDVGVTPIFDGTASLNIPVVGSGIYPKLTATESIYELTIAAGASLNLGGQTLNVGCNIYNNATTNGTGILNANNTASGITWNGTINPQSYTGTNNPSTAEVGNMTVSNKNAAGIINITGGPIDLFNQLNLTQGNLVINNAGNGALTLKSTILQTAAVGIIPSTCSVQGTVNVERFITGGGTLSNRGYRLLSSPVNQTADVTTTSSTFGLFYLNNHTYGGVNYGGAFTAGPGGTANGFNVANNNATIYLYDETQVYNNNSFSLGNHVPVNAITTTVTGSGATSTTTSTETLGGAGSISIPIGNGFLMYFVGSNTSRTDATTATPPDNTTLTANGHLNQGNFTIKLWNSNTLLVTTSPAASHPFPGYNMVGNPYACSIDLSKVISDNSTSIDNIYLLSALNSPNQFYKAFTQNGTSSPPAQGYAVSGEGFLVHAKTTGKTLTFSESEKVPAVQLVGSVTVMALKPQALTETRKLSVGSNSLSAVEPQPNTLTGLYMKIAKDSLTYNYCGIYFSKDWSDTYAEDDALDLNSPTGVTVMSSLSSDHIRLAVNHMPDYTKGVNVKLFASASTDGLYNLSIEGIRNIDTLYDIFLIDHYKTDSLDIRRYGSYAFNIMKSDTNSYGANRFELSVRPRKLPPYKLLNFTAQKVSAGVQVSWKTEAEGNYTGFVLQKQDGTTVEFNPLYTKQSDSSGVYTYTDPNPVTGNNTYRLQQSNIVGNISFSSPITIVYNSSGTGGALSVYPNPARATINVNVASASWIDTQSYKANIYNALGQLMMQKTVSSTNWSQDVTQYTPGTYIIQMTDNSGNLIGKSKFVKTN